MKNVHLALATCARLPDLWTDFQICLPAFHDVGVRTEIVVWDDPNVEWSRFDGVLLQSVWDYFEKYDEFLQWVGHVASRTQLLNRPDVVRWNSDKHYLLELEALGVPIIPTEIIDSPSTFYETEIESDMFVTKPTVSANSVDTYIVQLDELMGRVAQYKTPLLIQPFREEIRGGEISAVYFAGQRSHTVRKTPKKGDYRVQSSWGGTVSNCDDVLLGPFDAVADLVQSKFDLAYFRIDGLLVDNRLEVMELEAIEPELFLAYDSAAAVRYVQSVMAAFR